MKPLVDGVVHPGNAALLAGCLAPDSVALAVTSPPYLVGKGYEIDATEQSWTDVLRATFRGVGAALVPGGFLAVNINDILAFPDPDLPRVNAENARARKHNVTRADIQAVIDAAPAPPSRASLARHFAVSEQTIDRRLRGVNIRGGKRTVQTRVRLCGPTVVDAAAGGGLYLYDRRAWAKGPAWTNSPWHATSYRAVDEFEYIYLFHKPGPLRYDRGRLDGAEWGQWGSRGVWQVPSVAANNDHEARFPDEIPRRLIRLLSDPGDVILDPFAGSGTTLRVAADLGRRWIGFEIDPKWASTASHAAREASLRSLSA
ncbi:DNA-methyltransferase [Nostocoides jenkinsii]|uniref:Methyltransferase n=1 Tax=Nostocoides jenkinsii Ben 74 TaxID=1193518 RepID=A0A077MEJ3_9MICO|nr:DNA methyltransferase [Tetrasphaera jenkinsii]CCI53377.1 Modification methylase BglI [Tetrasphaera jenkinsii Ben 74]